MSRDKALYSLVSRGTSLGLLVVLSIVLAPTFGLMGIALASTIAYTVGTAVLLAIYVRAFGVPLRSFVPNRQDLVNIASASRGMLKKPMATLAR